jgi:hypothetical protein
MSVLSTSTNYLDQMMSIKMVKNLCSGNGKGKDEIIKFLLIIGMDEIKRLFKTIVDKIINNFQVTNWTKFIPSTIQPIFTYVLMAIKYIFSKIYSLFSIKKNSNLDTDIFNFLISVKNLNLNSYLTSIESEAKFQQCFWDQICSDNFKSNLSYNLINISSIDQIDNLTIISLETWSDIKISIPEQNLFIQFKNNIDFKFSTRYNKKTLTSILGHDNTVLKFDTWKQFTSEDFITEDSSSNKNIKLCKITFDKLIPCKQLCIILEEIYQIIVKFFVDENVKTSNLFIPIHNSNDKIVLVDNNYQYGKFDLQIENDKTKWNRLCLLQSVIICDFFSENGFIKSNCADLFDKKVNNIKYNFKYPSDNTEAYIKLFFGIPSYINIINYVDKLSNSMIKLYITMGEKIRGHSIFENENNWKLFVNHLLYINNCNSYYKLSDENSSSKQPNTNLKGFMPIQISSNHYPTQEELQKTFFEYLNNFSSTNISQKASKIKTFDIKMEIREEKVSIPNPAYQLHQKRIEDLKKANQSEINDKIISELISTMPPESIFVDKYIKEVVCTPINEVYKDLSRLYLSKKDKQKLITMLKDFRDDKDLLLDLGLPNKLAVLLYGEPGCGKSSTIESIGSYLQKDIYNINLQSVSTNEDLARLWDYVTNKTTNGGCIVIEDIDATSNIVLSRTLQSTNQDHLIYSITPNETPLTLSFFLNLIQGSCQRDGQVFITTTNWIDKLDPAFTRSMRFDVKINMRPATTDQILEIYSVYFPKRKIPIELIKQIPEYKYTPAEFIDCFRNHIKNTCIEDEELFSEFISL